MKTSTLNNLKKRRLNVPHAMKFLIKKQWRGTLQIANGTNNWLKAPNAKYVDNTFCASSLQTNMLVASTKRNCQRLGIKMMLQQFSKGKARFDTTKIQENNKKSKHEEILFIYDCIHSYVLNTILQKICWLFLLFLAFLEHQIWGLLYWILEALFWFLSAIYSFLRLC